MKVRVVARNDRGVFLGRGVDDRFYVFSLDDSREIEVGDHLRGQFDDTNGLTQNVLNLTRGQDVRISAESWHRPLEVACEYLLKLSSPNVIQAGTESFSALEEGASLAKMLEAIHRS